jgi:NAD(P)H dehydrogenase (quinone)
VPSTRRAEVRAVSDGLIGVTGATGEVGGRVARLLAERGAPIRLIVRDPGRAPSDLAGAEVRVASSYGARDEMVDALRGVSTLFLVPGRESADRVSQHRTAVEAAAEAGVARIVYLSFVDADTSSFTLGREHGATEEIVRASGLAWVFPRMSLYTDFIPMMADSDGVIRGPAGEGRLAAVLRDDLADAVAALLIGAGRHDGRTYDLTGPSAFTLAEAAAEMSRAWGRPFTFMDETLEEARASRAVFGAPDWEVEGWISSYVAIARGELERVSDGVEQLTGHPPRSLRSWLSETRP